VPTDLAGLLVEEGIVAADAMDRALVRQRVAGGALDSALLELGCVREEVLADALSRASGLPAAPAGALEVADARARRVFPSRVAERHGLAPFALDERELSLVAVHPVDLALLDEISFMLSLHLNAHVAPEWRVRALIHRLYGTPLPSRLAALASASGARAAAAPPADAADALAAAVAPGSEPAGPDEPTELMELVGRDEPADEVELVGRGEPADEVEPAGQDESTDAVLLTGQDGSDEKTELVALAGPDARTEQLPLGAAPRTGPSNGAAGTSRDARSLPWASGAPGDGAPGWTVEGLPEVAPAGEPIGEALARALEAELFPAEGAGSAARAEHEADPETVDAPHAAEADVEPGLAGAPAEDPGTPPGWTLDEARLALEAARDRDEAVRVALRYARDFFEFAALFAVARDAVAGHDALGPDGEDARELCRTVALYASEPGLFQQALETRALHLGPMPRDTAGNTEVLDGLGRGDPRAVLVYPVFVRDRPVCILYADNGAAPVSFDRVSELLRLLGGLGRAFERLIHDRKRRDAGDDPAGPGAAELPPSGREPAGASAPARSPPSRGARGDRVSPAPAGRDLAPAWTPAPLEAPPAETLRSLAEPFVAAVEPPFRPRPAPELAPPPPAPPREPDPWQAFEPGAALRELEVEVDLDPDAWPELNEPAPRFDPEAEVTALLATPPGSAARGEAVARLVAHPAESLPVLWARLPGPLEVEADDAAPDALGPLPAALSALGPAAVPAMMDVLRDPDPGRRRVAVAVLGASGDAAAFPALADRALDPDPRVAGAAVAALAAHRQEPGMRPIPERLRRALLSGVSARAAAAARALGALRDADAVPLLVQVLESSEREPASAAAEALTRITLQRHGVDPRRWLGWWRENRGRGRAEWLLSGLTHAEREVRVEAAAELSRAAPAPVAYSADAPPPERERAARAWAGWFARSGHFI
jgi:hypothetical protein